MKATGIVRRIDDLGRIVIPKEIRRTMRLREGEALEIFTGDTGEVVFKKYSPVEEYSETAGQVCEALWKAAGLPAVVCDRDRVVAAAGPVRREVQGRTITPELDCRMGDRKPFRATDGVPFALTPEKPELQVLCMSPILSDGDVTGCVAFVGGEAVPQSGEAETKLVSAGANLLGRQGS